jgi:hypothetical protein
MLTPAGAKPTTGDEICHRATRSVIAVQVDT